METRILTPEPLSVISSKSHHHHFVTGNAKSGGVCGKKDLRLRRGRRKDLAKEKEQVEKPTSSSGCLEHEQDDEMTEEDDDEDSNNSVHEDSSSSPKTNNKNKKGDKLFSSCVNKDGNSSSSSDCESLLSSSSNSRLSTESANNRKVTSANTNSSSTGAVGNKCKVGDDEKLRDSSDNDIVSSADGSADCRSSSYHSKYLHKMEDSSHKWRNSLKICANQIIERGTVFSPNDGDVRVLFLHKRLSQCPPDDIRFVFGCFDRITEDPLEEDKEIRLCNWIRFVKRAKKYQEGNIVARFSDRQPIFELTQTLLPGTELFVYFDIESITQINGMGIKDERDNNSNSTNGRLLHKTTLAVKSEARGPDGPLDLSKSPLEKPKGLISSQESTKFRSQISPHSEKHFSSKQSKPLTIFSISNVLQPIKLFQPYSTSHSYNNSRGSLREYSRTPPTPTMAISGNGPGIMCNNTNTVNKSNNIIKSSNNNGGIVPMVGMMTNTASSVGSSSPSATNSPTLRPILRTRGRERSLLPCDVCGKAFDRPSLLKRHMRTHTGEKPHICDVCSKGFSTSSSLNTHRRIHSGEKPHQCPICGKRFTASSNLYYHRMTHNKEKPHKCLLCGKSFPTPGDLKSHQYVHSGSWPYNCPICHRGFSKQTNLRNHLLLHSGMGDKPHNCQICGKKFALACNLRAHLRTHEEDPISNCISCKRTFLSSLNMLVNGHCRSCLLHQSVASNNASTTNTGNNSQSLSSGKSVDLVAVRDLSHSVTVSPASHATNTNSPDVSHQSLSNLSGLQGLQGGGQITPLPAFLPPHPTHALFHNSIADSFSNRPNPFLEQLFEWNYRFAKETAGNLGLHFQQKLLESQMLAAQLMSVSNTQGMNNVGTLGISDILRIRSQEFPSVDIPTVNKYIQQ